LVIQISNECICFATVLLGIFAIFLIKEQVTTNNRIIKIIVGLLFIALPLMLFLMIIQGRMVYQINNLILSEDITVFLLSLYYGSQHILFLVLGSIIIVTSFSKSFRIVEKIFSITIGFVMVIGSYPYLLDRYINTGIITTFIIWNVFNIIKLINIIDKKEHPTTAST
jgi:hypothetical protein